VNKRDYYAVLGLNKRASLEEIKQAYREGALRYHPDRVPAEQKREAEEKFKELSEAYAVLSDPQKRALYDQRGHAGIDQQYAYEDIFRGTDFGSIFRDLSEYGFQETLFDQLFGDAGFDLFGGRRRRRASGKRDLRVVVELSLEDAYRGVEKPLSVPAYDMCRACEGRGCDQCQGLGRVKAVRSLVVSIPPGVDTGAQLRLRGEGEGGPAGSGDLYVVVDLLPHPVFKRLGDDVTVEAVIPLKTALLGGEITVPTLGGEVHMKIPEGTQNGALFRLRGKGMPRPRASGRGDELVRIAVEIPRRLTPEQKRLLETCFSAEKGGSTFRE
jgi:molecular chaperone DnaJ